MAERREEGNVVGSIREPKPSATKGIIVTNQVNRGNRSRLVIKRDRDACVTSSIAFSYCATPTDCQADRHVVSIVPR